MTADQRLVAPKVARLLVDALKDEILGRRLAPGDMLPPPDELARRFGVSRPTVRESLNMLELQGLVHLKRGPKGGAIVRLLDHAAVTSALGDLLRVEGTTPENLWEVRLVLEPAGARLAAQRIDSHLLAQLVESVERQGLLLDDQVGWSHENIFFHTTIARAAENPVLKAFMDALRDLILLQGIGSRMTRSDRERSTIEHTRILATFQAGDAMRAETELRRHLAYNVDRTAPTSGSGGVASASPEWGQPVE